MISSSSLRTACLRALGAVAIVGVLSWAAVAHAAENQQNLLNEAKTTLSEFKSGKPFEHFNERLADAKAVLIVPHLVKAAFVVGGEGGSGVLLARDGTAMGWSYPVFYRVTSGSVGLQIGAEEAQTVFLILTDEALRKLMSNELKLGVDAGAAVVDAGAGVEGSTTMTFKGDIIAYSRAEGLYLGASFEGAAVSPDAEANRAYYGQAVSPADIIAGEKVKNVAADPLRASLKGG